MTHTPGRNWSALFAELAIEGRISVLEGAQMLKMKRDRDELLKAAKRFFEVADVQYADNFHDLRAAIAKADTSSASPVNSARKKCGHGPEMLKVVDLYCAQCIAEAK